MSAELQIQIDQLKFLLAQAPMIDAPLVTDPSARKRLGMSITPFAYIHPKTLSPFTWGMPPNRVYKFAGSSIMYVLCSLMPEGRILYSQLQIPGFGKLLAD